ncbi:hypothetical protein KC874_00625 [Candidatus Saccharibacteria bacterium]|nr:hypothetical protein [Candidatus Saccharibacteria bacterium]
MEVCERPPNYLASNELPLELSSIGLVRKISEVPYMADSIKQQLWDEETTRFAEAIDGPISTTFDFYLQGNELVSKAGNCLKALWKRSADEATKLAMVDPRYKEIAQIRQQELDEGELVDMLASEELGINSFIVISPYPEDVANLRGEQFINEQGYDSHRKITFIREFTKIDGGVSLTTKSVDNSELELWSEIVKDQTTKFVSSTVDILSTPIIARDVNIDTLIHEYDQKLAEKYQQKFKQGRSEQVSNNSYQFVVAQQDILDYNLTKLENLASLDLPVEELLKLKKEHTYGVMAAIENRYKKYLNGEMHSASHMSVPAEVGMSADSAISQGKSYISCGSTLTLASDSSQEASSLARVMQTAGNKMYCVSCPFCKKTVDAEIKGSTISCPKCLTSVNKKTGQVKKGKNIKPSPTFKQLFEELVDGLMASSKN